LLIGPPDEIIARLQRMGEEGIDYVLLSTRTQETVRIFAKEIMPVLA
jgi:alkanesulfonate monooxygenase SsuD/methylene tetrahydromethanopterin reductase-like flavin-dependent oxidoreductase (luciferase family)